MSGRLRIIGGEWRGRRLRVAGAPGLRPTGDRVRETLFNWLQGRVAGARVLDLFAGTGALGLEALSRGAADAVFVERARRAARHLEDHLEQLGARDRGQVWCGDAGRYPGADAGPFDLVFLDPPFASALQQPMLTRVLGEGWVQPGGLVYVESDARAAALVLPAGWAMTRETRIGAVHGALVGPRSD